VIAEPFDVRKQVSGGVGREMYSEVARMRQAPAAAALIEKHNAIGMRIEKAACAGRAPRARAAMEHDDRFTAWIATSLPVDEMPVADIEHAMLVWLNFWIAYCHRIFGHPRTAVRYVFTYQEARLKAADCAGVCFVSLAIIMPGAAPVPWPRVIDPA
jgi:hypothetical protein